MIELKETYTPLMGFKLEKGTEGIFILEKGSEFVKINSIKCFTNGTVTIYIDYGEFNIGDVHEEHHVRGRNLRNFNRFVTKDFYEKFNSREECIDYIVNELSFRNSYVRKWR